MRRTTLNGDRYARERYRYGNLVKSKEEIEQEMQAMQQQQLVQSLGSAALGSKLADPKNVLQAQQLATEQANAEQNPEA